MLAAITGISRGSGGRLTLSNPDTMTSITTKEPGTMFFSKEQLEVSLKRLGELDKSKPTAVYCASGYRASIAASILKAEGFVDVRNVPGSWHAWKGARYPVHHNAAQEKAA